MIRRTHLVAACVLGASIASAAEVRAEPYMAFREGYPCSVCHVNRTGGGKRTAFGLVYAQTSLPLWMPSGGFVSAELNDNISVGANLRLDTQWHMARDACWRREGATRWRCGSRPPGDDDLAVEELIDAEPNRVAFEFAEANMYFETKLLGDHVSLYVDTEMRGGLREAMVLAQNLAGPAHLYVKAGQFLLPYGIRLLDDGAFIRGPTGVNYSIRERGVEVGVEPGPFAVHVALTNGFEADHPNRLSALASGAFDLGWLGKVRAGASASYSRYTIDIGPDDSTRFENLKVGGFAGLSIGRFTLLGEYDLIRDTPSPHEDAAPDSRAQHVVFAELNFLVMRGLNLKAGLDLWDPDRSVSNNERSRFAFGVEMFPAQFLQLSLFYRNNRDIPQHVKNNVDEVIFQAHAFF